MIPMLSAVAISALLHLGVDERRHFSTLLAAGRYGWTGREVAAFVVRNGVETHLVHWPTSEEPHMAKWRGAIPPGTIAIVHTHRNRDTKPSRNDIRTAARVRLPVYVITPTRITVTDGDGVYTLAKGRWR